MAEQPTIEDFQAYGRVMAWIRETDHRAEIEAGLYEISLAYNEVPVVTTKYGSEPLTDELAERLGWVRTETGWRHG